MGFFTSMRKDWHACTWRGLAASSWPAGWKGRLCTSPLSSSRKAVGVAFGILSIPEECAGLQQAPAAGRGVGCGLGPVLRMGGSLGGPSAGRLGLRPTLRWNWQRALGIPAPSHELAFPLVARVHPSSTFLLIHGDQLTGFFQPQPYLYLSKHNIKGFVAAVGGGGGGGGCGVCGCGVCVC